MTSVGLSFAIQYCLHDVRPDSHTCFRVFRSIQRDVSEHRVFLFSRFIKKAIATPPEYQRRFYRDCRPDKSLAF